jgi:hypothetical protein
MTTQTLFAAVPEPMPDSELKLRLAGDWSEAAGGYTLQLGSDGSLRAKGGPFPAEGTWDVVDSMLRVCSGESTALEWTVMMVDAARAALLDADGQPVAWHNGTLPLQQEMVTLSLLAYVGIWGKAAHHETDLLTLINRFLATLEPVQNWQVAWGPAVKPSHFHISNEHVIFAVQDRRNPARYAVVIRGTNPLSLHNILGEVDSISQKAWPYAEPEGLEPKISTGVDTGLSELIELKAGEGTLAEGLTLTEFLTQLAAQCDGPLEVVTTGHSLGGALSPAMALWLVDTQTDWDPAGRATVSTVPVAGFSPGNADFATYFEQKLAARTQRVRQTLDAIPYMYAKDDMEKIATLYAPLIPNSSVFHISAEASILYMKLMGVSYQQIMTASAPLEGELHVESTRFVEQMLWQHVEGYLHLLGLEDSVNVKDLLEAHV